MSKANQEIRNYQLTDAEMLQASGVYHSLFQQDMTEFAAFDSDFDTPFSDNWKSKLAEAESASQDAALIDQLTGLTKAVDDKLEESRNHYQKMKYYIEKAFPGNKPVQNEFGFNDYVKARKSAPKFINFLTMFHSAAVKYTDAIIAAGVKQEDIDIIATLRDDLRNADQAQEIFKKNRPLETRKRIVTLNECWAFSQRVCKAGKIIFANNYVKYNQYLLPGEPVKTVEKVTEE